MTEPPPYDVLAYFLVAAATMTCLGIILEHHHAASWSIQAAWTWASVFAGASITAASR